jgi:hypothetical protein
MHCSRTVGTTKTILGSAVIDNDLLSPLLSAAGDRRLNGV